jgi:hypothetical protein
MPIHQLGKASASLGYAAKILRETQAQLLYLVVQKP